MKELFYGFRAYEIARHEKVQHYVWANCDYALRIAGWDEQYHWGHNDAKGRIGGMTSIRKLFFSVELTPEIDFILAQGQQSMKSTLFTVGPYMDMLLDGMFHPSEVHEDGTVVWENPSG